MIHAWLDAGVHVPVAPGAHGSPRRVRGARANTVALARLLTEESLSRPEGDGGKETYR